MFRQVRCFFSGLLLFLTTSTIHAQVPDLEINEIIEDLVEHLSEDDEIAVQSEALIDHLYEMVANPVPINQATADDLRAMGLLNEFQIHSILQYREEHGAFQSVYELQLVYGFDVDLVRQMQPFITLELMESTPRFKDNITPFRHELMARYQTIIEKQAGYIPESDSAQAKYVGDASKQYYRYQLKGGEYIKTGVTLEKDAGEVLFKDQIYRGLDFNSGYFQLNNKGLIKQVNLADYHANWGQGLILWTGFGMGKSSYTTLTEKLPSTISKYSSSDENRFLRGGSMMLGYKNWDLSLLYSSKKVDATIIEDSLKRGISSLYETGIHNTLLLLEKKDQVKEQVAGIRADYRSSRLRLGFSGIFHSYNKPVLESDKLYKFYHFSGSSYQNVGFDYHFSLKKVVFYGEEALSSTGGPAFLNAALIKVHPKMVMNVLHRHFSKKYHSHYSNAFSEGSQIRNEHGLYVGMDLFPLPKLKISGYTDAYRFPWLTYRCFRPSYGKDYLLKLEYIPDVKSTFKFIFKKESKEQNLKQEGNRTDIISVRELSKYRVDFTYAFSEAIQVKNRMEFSKYSMEKKLEKGMLFYQDVRFKPSQFPFNLYLRYYLFNTDGYQSRLYSYENDVLYTFNIPVIFDTGIRYYALVKWELTKNISCWLRYSRTRYRNKEVISSGHNEIKGNTKSGVKIQLRVKI